MKTFHKLVLAASIAGAAITATPAMAQVSGSIARAEPATAIALSQARQTAYQQIQQTYASQLQQINQKGQQAQTLSLQLDTNGDQQVSDQEIAAAQSANNPVLQQLQTLQNEINTLQQPIVLAELYALEQILLQYNTAQNQVVTANSIGVILTPDAFVYAPDTVDVTQKIATALNTVVPTVTTTPPANWRPQRQTINLRAQVQEILTIAQRQQQLQQQQQQQQQQQPSGR